MAILLIIKLSSSLFIKCHITPIYTQHNAPARRKEATKTMKALTVKQPWASLIVEGIKDIENRTWRCPQKYIGKRVLIHAGASKELDHIPLDGIFSEQQLSYLLSRFTEYELCEREYPHGAIIGSVEIVDCVINHPSIWAEKTEVVNDFEFGYFPIYGKKIYNWVLANPVKFEKPIPSKGRLSFWESEIEACHICGKPTTKYYECVICSEFYCDDCAARYNQFTQIDYNCCSSCAESHG
jgi:hypothetical protein